MERSVIPRIGAPRPRLKTGLTPLWRDDSTIQIGLDPERATIVGDVSPATAAVLRLLDGARTREEIEQTSGLGARSLLALLEERGLLSDDETITPGLLELDPEIQRRCAPEIAALSLTTSQPDEALRVFSARRTRRVLVRGAGRVGTSVAHLLAASGIGRVTVDDNARVEAADVTPGGASSADVGLRRGAAATALSVRAFPPALTAGTPDIAVICVEAPLPPAPETWSSLVEDGTAVLPVLIRESTAVIGPFIAPPDLAVSGCPFCVDHHRAERDPQWPSVAQQLRASGAPGPPAVTLVWATAALAVSQCLELLDRLDRVKSPLDDAAPIASIGATLELGTESWTWRRRWWGRHPACRCTA